MHATDDFWRTPLRHLLLCEPSCNSGPLPEHASIPGEPGRFKSVSFFPKPIFNMGLCIDLSFEHVF